MSEFIEYEPPLSSFKRLTQQDRSDEFKLRVVFEQEESTFSITTTVNKIRVISKTINNLFEIDPTTNEYDIHFPTQISKPDEIKNLIEKLLQSTEEKVTIEKEQEQEMNLIRLFLGETTQTDKVHIEIKTINEALSYLNTKAHSNSIEYLSTKINEIIEEGEIDQLNETIIKEIIDSYFEKEKEEEINTKEEIFSKLKAKENNNIVMHFLLQIDEEEYTEDMKEYIVNNLSDEIVSNELSQIIKNYQNMIINSKRSNNNKPTKTITIEYTNDELKGIISHLKETIDENLIEKNELKITSGHKAFSGSLSNLIEYNNNKINDYFQNNGGSRLKESEGWIEFDFGQRKINLTSYTLRTSHDSPYGCYHPKTWRILGSNDEKEWTLLDQQTNNSILNGQYKQHRFEYSKNNEYYQFIRYIQDDSWYNDREYCIYLTCVEFFGSISQ